MFDIIFQNDLNSKSWSNINSEHLILPTPAPIKLLKEYNELLGQSVVRNSQLKKYLTSPLLGRMEAQTGFFKIVCKYLLICEELQKANFEGYNVRVKIKEPELWIGIIGVAAGSLFVFKGKYKAVLINYPDRNIKEQIYYEN